jgi:hypothetical protein
MEELKKHLHPLRDRSSGDLRRAARFVDAHVHFKDPCCLDAIVEADIVAVRDAGSRNNITPVINKKAEASNAPVIVSARWALWKKGGYGSFFGNPVETRDEIQSAISTLKREGAGIIKIMASGMVSLKEPGRVTAGGFNKEELQFIVQTAATFGLGVMAHVNGERAILEAVKAGVRSIEHGFFISERAFDRMAKQSIYWVPTVGALQRAVVSAGASREAEDFVSALIRAHLKMIRRAHDAGVPLAVGTDCLLPDSRYAEAYDSELAYFELAGIPCDEVMKIACEGGARLLGI